MNEYANETKEVREIIKAHIIFRGGYKKFAKKIGMSYDSLKGKMSRRRRNNGTTEKLFKSDWNRIYFELCGEPWDDHYTTIALENQGKSDEFIGELIEAYEKKKEELKL